MRQYICKMETELIYDLRVQLEDKSFKNIKKVLMDIFETELDSAIADYKKAIGE